VNARALALAGKELKTYFRDTQALFFSLALPLVLVVLMVASFEGQTEFNATAYVVNLDRGAAGAELVERLRAVPEITVELLDEAAADHRLGSSDITNVVVIEPDFTARLEAGQTPGLRIRASKPQGPGAGGALVDVVYEKVGDIRASRPADVLIPGYLTMFVFFALALTAETLVGEKENSTLDRLMAGSATRLSIIAGKMLGAFGRGLIQIVVFWTAGVLLFDVYMGPHPVVVVGISVLLTLAASGVGVLLASLAKSQRSAGSMAVFISLTFAAFGGCWWPLFIMPKWLQTLAKVTPHAWANSAFNKLMVFGGDPGSVVTEMVALGLFALLFGGLAVWRFRVD
jgi:ABC-type Na+ efflux pump permease subunit